jgi:hypothetical protein
MAQFVMQRHASEERRLGLLRLCFVHILSGCWNVKKGQILIKRTEIKTIKFRPLLLVDSNDPLITPVRASIKTGRARK